MIYQALLCHKFSVITRSITDFQRQSELESKCTAFVTLVFKQMMIFACLMGADLNIKETIQ